jgi:hypothetical protein
VGIARSTGSKFRMMLLRNFAAVNARSDSTVQQHKIFV